MPGIEQSGEIPSFILLRVREISLYDSHLASGAQFAHLGFKLYHQNDKIILLEYLSIFVDTKKMIEEATSSKYMKLVEKSSSVKEDVTASRVFTSEEKVDPILVIFEKDTLKLSGETKTLYL